MPMYTAAKTGLLTTTNLLTGTVDAYLVGPGYTYDASHTNISSVAEADRKGPVALASKTVVDGVFRAAGVTFTGVASPPTTVSHVVLTLGTAPLVYVALLPGALTLNGSNVTLTWHTDGIIRVLDA